MNILTFDLEDWFHILDYNETSHPSHWITFESRIENNTNRILDLLDKHNQKATFFCLGWIAQKYPQLIQKIATKHEIACHSMNHQLIPSQSKEQFIDDLKLSLSILENIIGRKVTIYRAPGFSLDKENLYVFKELSKLNITVDCSIFPAKRNHGGIERFPFKSPCRIIGEDFDILEFPINTISFFSKQIIFSGGGYFRLLPYFFIKSRMKNANYVMTYFHPRDFDPRQPMLKGLPLKRKFMSYVGLSSSFRKLDFMLRDFDFVTVGEAAASLSLEKLPVVKY